MAQVVRGSSPGGNWPSSIPQLIKEQGYGDEERTGSGLQCRDAGADTFDPHGGCGVDVYRQQDPGDTEGGVGIRFQTMGEDDRQSGETEAQSCDAEGGQHSLAQPYGRHQPGYHRIETEQHRD